MTSFRRLRLTLVATSLLLQVLAEPLSAQTYTSTNNLTFTNLQAWNFGLGPLPASLPAGAVTLQSLGTTLLTATNDLSLTLSTLTLAQHSTNQLTVGVTLGGSFAFAGNAQLLLTGSGALTLFNVGTVIGSSAAGLTVAGSGTSALTFAAPIASSAGAGAPLTIGLANAVPNVGIVTLSVANTFAGGVVLNGGTLTLANDRALGVLGNQFGTLTVNGGSLQGSATLQNSVILNSTLFLTGPSESLVTFGLASGFGLGGLSGGGGLTVRNTSGASISVASTYAGATEIGQVAYPTFGSIPLGAPGVLRLNGASGSILATSALTVADGGRFEINKTLGDSLNNSRLSTATPITVRSGFLEVYGSAGFSTQALGSVTGSGQTSLLASTTGAVGSVNAVSVANLVRTGAGTFTFTGQNLGATLGTPGGASQANIFLGQIDGLAPAAALVGGGGAAGTSTRSILPWAVGDGSNFGASPSNGTGFVTYDLVTGVRLLNPTTEYNVSNNFNTAGASDNVRLTAAPTGPSTARTVNSLFVATSGLTLSGSQPLTLSSGALASNVAVFTLQNPVLFGAGGTGEAIVSVISSFFGSPNTVTANAALTASTLTKSGQGTLVLGSAANAFASNLITINGGYLSVPDLANLGVTNNSGSRLTIHSPTATAQVGLIYTGAGATTLSVPITLGSGFGTLGGGSAGGNAFTVAGVISGPGGLDAGIAGGRLELTGLNTYTGGTRTAGALVFSRDENLGAAAGGLFLSGQATVTGNWTTARTISFNGGPTLTTDFTTVFQGRLTGLGPVNLAGAATATWEVASADNPFSGTFNLQSGTLRLTGPGELNTASVTLGGTGNGSLLLDLSGATSASGTPWRSLANLDSNGPRAHAVQLGLTAGSPVDLRVGAGSFGSTAGVLQGFGALVKTGGGTLTLQNANTFTGRVEIWGGTLSFSADNQLGAAANAIVLRGTLNPTVALTSNRNLFLGASTAPLAATLPNVLSPSFDTTLSGVIANETPGVAGGFEKTGGGILTLSGLNTYTGPTRLFASTLAFTQDANLGAGGDVIFAGGILRLAPAAAAPVELNRRLIVTATSSFENLSAQTLTHTGALLGTTNVVLTRTGSGNVVLNSDARLYPGTLTIGNASVLGSTTFGGGFTMPLGSLFFNAATSSVDLSNPAAAPLVREFGSFGSSPGTTIDLGSVRPLVLVSGFSNAAQSWAGTLTGSAGSLVKLGTGTLAISGGVDSSGGFTVLAGDTTVSGTIGAIATQTSFTLGGWGSASNNGTRFTLDNVSVTVTNRVSDTQQIYSNNSQFVFSSNPNVASTELIDSFRGAGFSTITLTTGGTLSFTSATAGLSRIDRGTFLFRAGNANLGSAAATPAIGNLRFGNQALLGLLGGGGAPGSTDLSILPYAIGGVSAFDAGSTLVTYGANGVRPLTTAEFAATLGGATNNVRLTASTTLALDTTANALVLAASSLRLGSTALETLTLTSGVLLNASGLTSVYETPNTYGGFASGVQVAELRSGAANERELQVFVAGASGALTLGALISTSGGLTKSGDGTLYLTRPGGNTYTGGTVVNGGQLVIDSLAAINDSATQTLTLSGGFLRYRGPDAILAGAVRLGGGSAHNPGSAGGLYVPAGTTLGFSQPLSGYGSLVKDGPGVLALTAANTYSGDTFVQAGTLALSSPAALGASPRIYFGSSNATGTGFGGVLRFDAPMTLGQSFATSTSGLNFDTAGNNVTLTGAIISRTGNGLTKFGAGDLTLTAAAQMVGVVNVFGGNLVLGGAEGSMLLANGTGSAVATIGIAQGAGLVLDNTVFNNPNRLPDVFSMPTGAGDNLGLGGLRLQGGELRLRGNAQAPSREQTNRFELFTGTVTLENNGQNVTLSTGRVTRAVSNSVVLVRGQNLGDPVGPGSTNWFALDLGSGSTQLNGAGGAAGTPFVSIVPGFIGDRSQTGNGTDLMTYDAGVGFRLLGAAEYASSFTSLNFHDSRAANVRLSNSTVAPALTTWINALKLEGGVVLSGQGTLELRSSTVLATGSSSINVPALHAEGSAGYAFYTAGAGTNLTVQSTLSGASLFKSGQGTLTLSGPFLGAGNVLIEEGTLLLSGSRASLHPRGFGATVTVAAGATLDLGGFDRSISNLNSALSLGSFGRGVVQDGTVQLGDRRLTLRGSQSSTFSGDLVGTGGLTLANATTALTQPVSYSGPTHVFGGSLQLVDRGTLLNSSLFEIRGGSLSLSNQVETGGLGYVAQRISAAATLNLAGSLNFSSNVDRVATQALGQLNLVGGANLTIENSTPLTLTIAQLNRAAERGTLTLTGNSLGQVLAPNGGANVFATAIDGAAPASALVGGGGLAGSTSVSILPWANSGSTFYTYGAQGFRPLDVTEFATSITAGATANVRPTVAVTLSAPTTVNSLLLPGSAGLSGAFDLTLTSGALAYVAGSTVGVPTNSLLTGAGNTRDLVVYAAAPGNLDYRITTSGALVKFGAGALTLGAANSYAGGTFIQEGGLSFSADDRLGAAGSRITFGNPGTTNAALLSYTGSQVLEFQRPLTVQSFGSLAVSGGRLWALHAAISGPGRMGYGGINGFFEINAVNSYTGDTQFNGSNVSILNDTAFGQGGALVWNGSGPTVFLRGDWNHSRLVLLSSSGQVHTNGFDTTWSGQIAGTNMSLTKYGQGTWTVTGPATLGSGGFLINAGEFRLRDGGTILSTGTQTVAAGARFLLDDSGQHFSDRLPDASGAVSLVGGELVLRGNRQLLTEEVINTLTLNSAARVTLDPGPGQAALLRLGPSAFLNRGNGASPLFRGSGLGEQLPGSADSSSLLAFDPASVVGALVGGGGAPGSTAVSIIAGAFGDTSARGLGQQLVTYDTVRGVRLLTASEYATGLTNGARLSDNVRLSAHTAIASPTAVNALWLSGGVTLSGAGPLTLAAGNLLVTGSGNVIATPLTTPDNTVALAVGGPGDVRITSNLTSLPGGLIKSGAGVLTLTGTNTYVAATTLAGGTLAVESASALSSATTLRVIEGALTNTSGGPLTLSNVTELFGDLTFAGSQDLTLSNAFRLQNGVSTIRVTGAGTLRLGGDVSQSPTVPGLGLVKDGPGALILASGSSFGTGVNAYGATTTIRDGTLFANNSSGSATGGSTITVLAGGTLAGSGFLQPQQGTEARNAISILAGGTIRGGAGGVPGTLTLGVGTTPGVTTASLSLASGAILGFHYTGTPVAAAANTGNSLIPGSGSSLLNVQGRISLSTGTRFALSGNVANFTASTTYSFRLATATVALDPISITSAAQFDFSGFAGYNPGVFSALQVTSSGLNLYLNLTVSAPTAPTFVSATTTTFTVGAHGTFQLVASGFPAPSFSVTGGALPAGLTLSPGGLLSGTLPAFGTFPAFTVTATNGLNPDAVQAITVVANRAPQPGADLLNVTQGQSASVTSASLLANDADSDGDALSLVAVSATSAQGGSVQLAAGNCTYTPPSNAFTGSDSFTYTLSDGRGGFAFGTVQVVVTPLGDALLRIVSLVQTPGGPLLTVQGLAGREYFIEQTDSLTSPWIQVAGPLTAGADGTFQYQDPTTPLPPARFYRGRSAPTSRPTVPAETQATQPDRPSPPPPLRPRILPGDREIMPNVE
ncbi:MAG: autotransporter-associated beta strand repeat-containing protein [Verrucomicrobia bacterium]|nr:autotransporter-associated beta strand repeat-containing protein [Verrucomicrobiota bacterium]